MRRPRQPVHIMLLVAALAMTAIGCSDEEPDSQGSGASSSDTTPANVRSDFTDANGVNLEGVWTSTDRQYYSDDQSGTGEEALTVTDQEGPLFRATRDIMLDGPEEFGDDAAPAISVTDQPLLGIVNADGSITMVKFDDSGRLDGRLTDDDTMILSYTEAGDPGVARITLVRSADAATPTS
jgi:hypothetical protein